MNINTINSVTESVNPAMTSSSNSSTAAPATPSLGAFLINQFAVAHLENIESQSNEFNRLIAESKRSIYQSAMRIKFDN